MPIYNRRKELEAVLTALTRQRRIGARVEVLICDDGSREDLNKVFREQQPPAWMEVVHLRLKHAGASAARNAGFARATGTIVALTDSDCVPSPEWLDEIVTPFDDPTIGIVGGHVDHRAADTLSGRCVNYLMSSVMGGGARDPRCMLGMEYYPRAGNMAVLRSLAIAAGGFPPVAYGEDVEFSHRVIALGFRQAFAPSAVVLHNESRCLFGAGREAYCKGQARVRMARSAGLHEKIHAVPAFFTIYVAIAAAGAVCIPRLLPYLLAPLCVYLLLSIAVGVRAAVVTGDARIAPALVFYAFVMHIGYGLGYLDALCAVIRRTAFSRRTSDAPASASTLHAATEQSEASS
ncbi:MAG: glycosyltransferase [Pirellulales bacterium]